MTENIIGSGAKRMRHGAYKTCYLDNRGNGRKAWRAEIQMITPGGAFRTRKWFNSREEARAWLNGK